jgi:hypothetical protein
MKIYAAGQFFLKFANTKFYINPSSGSQIVLYVRMDGRAERNPQVLRMDADAPKTKEHDFASSYVYSLL